jgi:ATP-binding cassette subfamily B protein
VFLALFGVATILALATAARFYTCRGWASASRPTSAAPYRHVVTQSPEFFETTQTGEVLSRITTDTTLIKPWSAPASRWRCATCCCSSAAW